jgi:hypothetical protein
MVNKFTRPESPVAGLDARAVKLRDQQMRGLSLGVSHEGAPGAGAAPPSFEAAGVKVPPHAPAPTAQSCPDCGQKMDDADPADNGLQQWTCPICQTLWQAVADGSDDSADDDTGDADNDSGDDFGNSALEGAGVPPHPNIASRAAAISDDDVGADDVPQEAVMDESGGDADALDDVEALREQFPMVECPHCGGAWQLREHAMPLRCPNEQCQAVWSTRDVRLTEGARDLLDKATKRRGRDRFSEV